MWSSVWKWLLIRQEAALYPLSVVLSTAAQMKAPSGSLSLGILELALRGILANGWKPMCLLRRLLYTALTA